MAAVRHRREAEHTKTLKYIHTFTYFFLIIEHIKLGSTKVLK